MLNLIYDADDNNYCVLKLPNLWGGWQSTTAAAITRYPHTREYLKNDSWKSLAELFDAHPRISLIAKFKTLKHVKQDYPELLI